jgi:hypothetical protein
MMTKISHRNTCPAFVPAPLVGPVCVIFEATTMQVAQASLPATAVAFTTIGSTVGNLITAALPAGIALTADACSLLTRHVLAGAISAGSIAVDAFIPGAAEPTLAAHLLPDQISHCGSVEAIVTARTTAPYTSELVVPATPPLPIRVTVPAGTMGSSMVTLSIHSQQDAPGALPSDNILERVVTAEGATTCLVGGTTVDSTGGLVTTTLVSIRATYGISLQVVRVLNPSLPSVAEAVMDVPEFLPAAAIIDVPELPPAAAVRTRKQRTIVWSLSVDEKRTD